MTVTRTTRIDWITATMPITSRRDVGEPVSAWALRIAHAELLRLDLGVTLTLRADKPTAGFYAVGVVHEETGLVIDVPYGDRMQQGLKLTASGGIVNISHSTLHMRLVETNWKITRLDVALDERGGIWSVDDILDRFEMRVKASDRKKRYQRTSSRNGNSASFGARSSRSYVRLYDKAAEQGLAGESWVRLEAEFKDTAAGWASRMVYKTGTRSLVKAIFEECSLNKIAWFRCWQQDTELIKQVDKPVYGRKETDTEKWLKTIVLSSIVKLAQKDGKAARDLLDMYKLAIDVVTDEK